MLSHKIDKILIADSCLDTVNILRAAVVGLAPHANIRATMNQNTMRSALTQWRPVLLVVRLPWLFNDAGCILCTENSERICTPPFVLGLNESQFTRNIVEAMRCGCTEVIDMTEDKKTIQQAVMACVSVQPQWIAQLRQAVVTQLYSDYGRFDFKKMQKDIEQQVFCLAFSVSQSKNELSKLFGISRQLVQYHLKKINSSTAPH